MAIRTKRREFSRHHVLAAARKWEEQPGYGGFQTSRHYDVVINGKHYPPKAIVAIAKELAGANLMRPADFPGARDGKWHKVLKELDFPVVPKGLVPPDAEESGQSALAAEDISHVLEQDGIDATTRETLVLARLGQGKFRKELLELWDNQCAVTGCALTQAIRASHSKPWCDSDDDERLNPNNGLPLIATLDALFDAGLITFDASAQMIVSPLLDNHPDLLNGIPRHLTRVLTADQARFLEYHRQSVFRGATEDDVLF
ncbi:HNH endonuclease [Paraburkholderia silvatlantica]|uniref:HNH endonuclease n=1 Tax=Paraburkholderia silvatlantica TaxID=321895 RepID=UPI0010EFE87B|nr:HNH endonuclease [Paraburkholderia silvatlantica]TDR04458.1 HNH endonuclease [Paraburkholderia silvatlantica]